MWHAPHMPHALPSRHPNATCWAPCEIPPLATLCRQLPSCMPATLFAPSRLIFHSVPLIPQLHTNYPATCLQPYSESESQACACTTSSVSNLCRSRYFENAGDVHSPASSITASGTPKADHASNAMRVEAKARHLRTAGPARVPAGCRDSCITLASQRQSPPA